VLSLAELRRAARVLDAVLAGAVLREVRQPAPLRVVLELHRPRRRGAEGGPALEAATHRVLLSCEREGARVSGLERMPQAGGPPPAFTQYLRAHAQGGRCEGARVVGDDRQLALRFTRGEGGGELLLSVLGARSNLYWIDGQGALRAALRPLQETRRGLALGAPWRDPETAAPAEGADRFAAVGDAELLAAIEAHYAERESEGRAQELARRVAQALRKEEASIARTRERIVRELEEAQAGEADRRAGELLKTVLPSLRPRQDRALVRDPESGEEVAIALDPALSPARNLERYFERWRKSRRRIEQAQPKLAELTLREAELARTRAEVEAALERAEASPEALTALAARPEIARLVRKFAPQARAEGAPARPKPAGPFDPELPPRLRPRRYRSSSGLEIWVGRSDEGNDHLTTRLARGRDWFLHLDGAAGSHVVLRTEGREDPPSETLLEACELAVHFSKQAEATRADVHVAAIRDVSKPKRAKPGLVHVHRGRTVHLRRDPARLARILAARIED
jgi:predicted ribosome quality control (RQC) complex YloA/Tae2 family protein